MKKQRWEESEKRREKERRSEKRKSQKKEDAGARKGRKVVIHCVFLMICGSRGLKSRLAKAAGAEPSGRMNNCMPLWRESHLEVKKLKAPHVRSTFGNCDVEKVHAWKSKCTKHTMFGALLEVAMFKKCAPLMVRSTFRSQNVQSAPRSEHFWKLRC